MDKINAIRGLIRPFISVCFVGTTVVLAILGKIEPKDILTVTSIIVSYHFGERAALKKPEGTA